MKNKNFLTSLQNAINGIYAGINKEMNIKIHLTMMVLVIIAGIFFKLSLFEWIICILLFGLVIGAELFNTAIESAVDHAGKHITEEARIAKDVAAGAVLVISIVSAIIGLIIFLPKLFICL